MQDEGVAFRPGGEFRLLHFLNIVAHPLTLSVGMGEVEHVEPHAVDPREGNKLVFVSHVRQLLLEAGDGFIIEIFLPVKRRRAVIGQQFARETRMDSLGKAARLLEIRFRRFTPHQIRIRRVGQPAADRLLDPGVGAEEPFAGAIPGNKLTIVRIAV